MSTKTPSSPAANQKQINTCGLQVAPAGLDDLPDELLLEILARVPTTRSIFPAKEAARLRAVSRRWNSIISSRNYIPCIISLGEENNCPWGNGEVLLFPDFLESGPVFYMLPSQCDPTVLDQTMPDCSYVSDDDYLVVSASEDLLLLLVRHQLLVVCNPFTKRWAALPNLPDSNPNLELICEPEGHRYRVVSTEGRGNCETVFVSETGEWKEFLLGTDEFQSNILSFRGKLYWYSSDWQIVSYDPFEDSFSFFPDPDPDSEDKKYARRRKYTLSAVHGSLRVLKSSCITRFYIDEEEEEVVFHDFISWELDFKQKRWSLIYKSSLRNHSCEPHPVALHPNGRVVYLDTHRGLASHDLSQGSNNFSRVAVKDEPEDPCIRAFLLTRPWRPTSVCYGSSRLKNPGKEDDTMGMGQRWRLGGKKGKAEGEFHGACLHEEAWVASTTSSKGGSFEHEQMVSQHPDDIQPPPDIPVSTSNQLFKPAGVKPALMAGVGLQILQQLSGINGVLYYNLGLSSDSVSLMISVLTMLMMLLFITVSMRLMDVAVADAVHHPHPGGVLARPHPQHRLIYNLFLTVMSFLALFHMRIIW